MADTLQSVIDRINQAVRDSRPLRTAITTVLAVHKPRIFEQGLAGDGSKIGTYSTVPSSISKKQQAKNTGKTYFKGGYAEYKTAIGKNPGFVNLVNTGQMQADYGIIAAGNKFGLGFNNPHNANKSQWMQDKYDKQIFDHTNSELEIMATVLADRVIKLI